MARTGDPRSPAYHREGIGRTKKRGAAIGKEVGQADDWNARYESLRQSWLNGGASGETAIVVRQGLLAWIRTSPLDLILPLSSSQTPKSRVREACESPINQQLVVALVNLILNRRLEEPS